jgi:hypothetical protein
MKECWWVKLVKRCRTNVEPWSRRWPERCDSDTEVCSELFLKPKHQRMNQSHRELLHLAQVCPSPHFCFLVLVLLELRSLRPDRSEDERRSIPQAVPEIFKTYELDHSHPVGAHMLLEKSNPESYSSD